MSPNAPPAGRVKEVTSLTNPLVKEIRGLALKKNRDATGRFVGEGLKLVADALDGGWQVHTVLYARDSSAETPVHAVAARARARGALILEVSNRVLAAISRRDNPQSVIGVFGQQWTNPPPHGEAEALWIALDRIRDPGNLGTIVRTADAVGAAGIMLIGECTDPFGLEAVRATMGSVFSVPICRLTSGQFLEWRSGWNGLVVGTHLQGDTDYRAPDYRGKAAILLMGNEQQGLADDLAQSCDFRCRIPMAGAADSLNLAVSTGIMAFEMRRHALGAPASGKAEP